MSEKYKIFLRIIATALVLAVSAMLCTVGAWIITAESKVDFSGSEKIQAAKITGPAYTVTVDDVYGIPGETQIVCATIEITYSADRDFIYGIDIPREELLVEGSGNGENIIVGKAAVTADGSVLYGKMDKTRKKTEAKIQLIVEFNDFAHPVNENYTQAMKLNLHSLFDKISVRYCQATYQAAEDAFGKAAAESLEGVLPR